MFEQDGYYVRSIAGLYRSAKSPLVALKQRLFRLNRMNKPESAPAQRNLTATEVQTRLGLGTYEWRELKVGQIQISRHTLLSVAPRRRRPSHSGDSMSIQ